MPDNDTPKPNTDADQRAADVRRKQGPLDEPTAEVLNRIYVARRLEYQLGYYRSKLELYGAREDAAFRAGAIIMTLTSLLAAFGTQADAPAEIRLLTAILPAFAATVTSFRQLYQWDRQAQLFKGSALGLERASLILPDLDQVDTTTAAKVFPALVAATEQVFEDEVNQWGQIAVGATEESEKDDSLNSFAKDYGIDIYDADGNLDESKLAAVKDILAVSRSRTRANTVDLSVSYPEVGAGGDNQTTPTGGKPASNAGDDVENKLDSDSETDFDKS